MARWGNDATELIGNTPMVRLNHVVPQGPTVLAKLESFQPGYSVKDRIAVSMINEAEKDGTLKPGATIIEPTSGNTGIGLAWVAAARGYHCILVMPESVSVERRMVLKRLGAEVVLTPAPQRMPGSIARAQELVEHMPGSWMPQQFENPANPKIHRETTAEEIWRDTEGQVDAVIAGVGTGGTLTGVGEVLKARKPSVKMIAVEPEDSAVLSGGPPGPHKIQGIGAGFVPQILDTKLIDEVLRISNDNAFKMAREAARLEGIAVGISSGAAIAAGIELGQRADMAGKLIAIVLPD